MKNTNPLDLAKNNSNQLELEDIFEEYVENFNLIDWYESKFETNISEEKIYQDCKIRCQEIIQEVTKQIQSDLLREILELKEEAEDSNGFGSYEVITVGSIKKLAEEKGIIINK